MEMCSGMKWSLKNSCASSWWGSNHAWCCLVDGGKGFKHPWHISFVLNNVRCGNFDHACELAIGYTLSLIHWSMFSIYRVQQASFLSSKPRMPSKPNGFSAWKRWTTSQKNEKWSFSMYGAESKADMGTKPGVTKPKRSRSFDTLKSTKPKPKQSRSLCWIRITKPKRSRSF